MRYAPREYQKHAIKKLVAESEFGLFMRPGLGKTSVTLAAFKLLRDRGLVGSMLVIAPKRICYHVWPNELKKWDDFRGLTYRILHGKTRSLGAEADIYLINPEGLGWLMVELARTSRWPFEWLVVDESTRFKHTNTQRFKLLKNSLHRFMRRTILTGTPTPNGMLDLFGQIMVMDMGKSLGKFITHYRNEFFEQSGYMGYEWRLKPDGEQRILNRIKHCTLSLSDEDLLELPERVDLVVDVALPEDALKKYRELERELVLELEQDTVTAASAGVAAMKCRQLANGGIYLPTPPGVKRKWEHVHEAKLDALEEIVEELQGAPALVAYEFEHDLDRLRGRFGKATPALHGGMKEHDVGEIISRWNRGEIPLLFVQPQTSALGLNLQESGSTIVWFGLVWDLEIYDQLVKRIWRSGQRAAHVYVHHLVATDTVDEVILKALRSKDTGQRKLMDALKVHMKNKWRQAVTKAA